MANNTTHKTATFAATARTTTSGVARAFDRAKKCIVIFGVGNAIVLGTLIVIAFGHEESSSFMWIRATIMLAVTPVLYTLAVRAEQGNRSAFQRLQIIVAVLPIAIVAVDLVPGVCPVWYAAMQGASALALVPINIIIRRREFRTDLARQW